LFDTKPRIRRDFDKDKLVQHNYYEYSLNNNTTPIMLKNIVKFIFGVSRNFRSGSPVVDGQKPRLGHLEYMDTPNVQVQENRA